MRVVVAPDSFKGSLAADDAARALARGCCCPTGRPSSNSPSPADCR
jgi:glycerate kinase